MGLQPKTNETVEHSKQNLITENNITDNEIESSRVILKGDAKKEAEE